jgi:uncharacterized protein
LDSGADVNATNSYGTTALIDAASRGRSKTVEILLDSGADVNATNSYGMSALYLAGNAETAELLIKAGARLDTLTVNGDAITGAAVRANRSDVLSVLTNALRLQQ